MIGSRGKVHLSRGSLIRISATGADVRRAERPDATDGKRVPRRILQQPVESAARQIVSRDKAAGSGRPSAGKLADQQIVTEAAEIERSESDTPGSIQPIAVLQAPQQLSRGRVSVHEAQSRTIGFR